MPLHMKLSFYLHLVHLQLSPGTSFTKWDIPLFEGQVKDSILKNVLPPTLASLRYSYLRQAEDKDMRGDTHF